MTEPIKAEAGTELALTSTEIRCETRFSTASLAASIPEWLENDLLERDRYSLPARLPDCAAMRLREVAGIFRDSLSTPALHEERTAILGELRLVTATRNENAEEARARFRLLRAHLDDVPADILREATKAYAKVNKFFPVGPAELQPFIQAISLSRSKIAYQLRKLADEAEERLAEERRLEKDPLTPEVAAAIIEEFGLRPETAERIRPTGPARKPTIQDYIDLGVDRETAERCAAESRAAA